MVKQSGRPGYQQIADDIREQIHDGRLAPGDALPSIAQLSADYGASTGVVKAAITVLRTEGAVVGQQGKGVFVTDKPVAPSESSILKEQIAELLDVVRDLAERVARLEQGKPPRPPRT